LAVCRESAAACAQSCRVANGDIAAVACPCVCLCLLRSRSVARLAHPAGILTVQLLITMGIVALFVLNASVRAYVQTHVWTYVSAM
jgi:hypothetical protein